MGGRVHAHGDLAVRPLAQRSTVSPRALVPTSCTRDGPPSSTSPTSGKDPVTMLPGAAYFHHADSFAMMRGGHLNVCVLGVHQVPFSGDLANRHTGKPDDILAVGGAVVYTCLRRRRQGRSDQGDVRRRCRRPRGAMRHQAAAVFSCYRTSDGPGAPHGAVPGPSTNRRYFPASSM